jgi:RimJ/RimL family protein N-acetyltransferase
MSLFHLTPRASARPVSGPGGVTVRLRDGVAVLRPLGPDEGVVLDAVFEQLSPESREARFLTGMPRLPRVMRDALAAVDGHDHVAWAASVAGRPVGIARYVRVEPEVAELAFEVADGYQGLGLGSALVDTVTTVAMVSGVRRICADVLASNHRSRHLLAQVGLQLDGPGELLEGVGTLRLLERARVDRRAVVRIATGGDGSEAGG